MRTALICEIVFMAGLAAGRLLVLLLSGWPSPMLIAYAFAELLLAAWGIYVSKSLILCKDYRTEMRKICIVF